MNIEIELIEAKKKLKEEEYKLKWSGYLDPYQYICSAQYTVTRYWRNKVKELDVEKLKRLTNDE